MLRIIRMFVFVGIILLLGFLAIKGFNYLNNSTDSVKTAVVSYAPEDIGPNGLLLREKPSPTKDVEILDLTKNTTPQLEITKTGTLNASTSISISPEISGKVTEIYAKVGEKIAKDTPLIKLGDSLNTDILEAQKSAAEKSLLISRKSRNATNTSANSQIESAQVAVTMAQASLEAAIKNRQLSYDSYLEQAKNTELEIDNAQNNYDSTETSLDYLYDTLDDLEDDLDDLKDDIDDAEDDVYDNIPGAAEQLSALKTAKRQLESSITQTESQIDSLKYNSNIAANRLDQAQVGFDSLNTGYVTQITSLDLAIESAKAQLESAQSQLTAAQAGKDLQLLQVDAQITQVESTNKIADIQNGKKEILSPISGTITSVSVENGQLVNPGQSVITIEDLENLEATFSISEEEKHLLALDQTVTVTYDGVSTKGTISEISPTLDPTTKKVEVTVKLKNTFSSKTGSFVKISFTPITKGKIFIPLNSVSIEEGKKIVYTVSDGRIVYVKDVTLGEIVGDYVEITRGLEGDEKIVTSLSSFVSEGEKVNPIENEQ